MRRAARFLFLASAIAYPLALAALAVALGTIGEGWWPTTIGLYVPRMLFALPLAMLVLGLAVWGPRWMLLLQVGGAAVLLFPLMGLCLGREAPASGPTLTVLSYNADFGHNDRGAVVRRIAAADPDVIALQAIDVGAIKPLLGALPSKRHVHRFDEFFVASKYPIVDFEDPPPLDEGVPAAYVRVTIDGPLGRVDVYVTHPKSPRRGFQAMRGEGLGRGLETGDAFSPEKIDKVTHNTVARVRQVEALGARARAAANPVIIAGDTNLPALSPLFRRALGDFKDGWCEVGTGFGYTFPADKWLPWMRIDRILAGKGLRFVAFEVGPRLGSEHLAVMATLTAGGD